MAGALLSEKVLLFCAKTIVKVSRKVELARLKKKKNWAPLGVLFVMKTLEDER